MPRLPCPPQAEIIGRPLLGYIDNLKSDEISPLLAKYGFVHVRADDWYPLPPWIDFINELSTRPHFTENMIAVGLRVAENAVTPAEMQGLGLGQFLEGWNHHLYANHRNADIGTIVTEKVSDTFYRTIHRHVYPDDMHFGIAYGFARTILPRDTKFVVWYEDNDHRMDRGGGDETVICVKWE